MAAKDEASGRVPEGAVWSERDGVWEFARREGETREGESRTYREDGTLLEVRRFARGVMDGPFTAYHPDGTVARRGTFVAGEMAGAYVAFASDAPTNMGLRACCVPENAWELRARYLRGRANFERFFDRAGRALLDSGALRPAPPEGVPETADFNDLEGLWLAGDFDDLGQPQGTFRFWTQTGVVTDERDFRDGALIAERHYTDGRLTQSSGWQEREGKGALHGAYFRRFAADENPYADPRLREERGAHDRGHPCGAWSLLDEAGATLARRELGPALDETDVARSPAFAEPGAADSAGAWEERAQALRAEHRLREALCAAARAAVARGDAGRLRALLDETTLPLGPARAVERGQQLVDSSTTSIATALDGLVGGADAASAFRALAGVLDLASSAALDFANASLLLEDRPMTHLTRALIRVEHGDEVGARADAEVVARAAPDAARKLQLQMKPRFPRFDFWPAREPLEVLVADGAPEGPAQPLPALHHMIQVYATRLTLLRSAVQARRARQARPGETEPAWMPPDLTALLPDGPFALRRYTTTIDMESENGTFEPTEIQVDETLPEESLAALSMAELLAAARAHWAALTWLCWGCGLDRVALPEDIVPPPTFAAAVAMSVSRCFRAHDQAMTGGVRARTQGVPAFTWEGLDVGALPTHLAMVVAAEYLELRSMFLWLALDDSVSPFQADLRQA